MIYSIIISLLIHASALYLVKVPKHKSTKRSHMQVTVREEGEEKGFKQHKLYVLNKALNKVKALKQKGKTSLQLIRDKDCEKFYIGIGITHWQMFHEISTVVPGGPADLAGIKVKDILTEPDLEIKDVYPIGTTVNIGIIRDGIIMNIPVKVGKICMKD